jgi:hypothetical protein
MNENAFLETEHYEIPIPTESDIKIQLQRNSILGLEFFLMSCIQIFTDVSFERSKTSQKL